MDKTGDYRKLTLSQRIASLHRDILLFISSIAMVGFAESIVNSVFNNFLSDTFRLNSFQRTFMEFPRELPGFLVIFVSAALYFVRSRRLAVFATMSGAGGPCFDGFFFDKLPLDVRLAFCIEPRAAPVHAA